MLVGLTVTPNENGGGILRQREERLFAKSAVNLSCPSVMNVRRQSRLSLQWNRRSRIGQFSTFYVSPSHSDIYILPVAVVYMYERTKSRGSFTVKEKTGSNPTRLFSGFLACVGMVGPMRWNFDMVISRGMKVLGVSKAKAYETNMPRHKGSVSAASLHKCQQIAVKHSSSGHCY